MHPTFADELICLANFDNSITMESEAHNRGRCEYLEQLVFIAFSVGCHAAVAAAQAWMKTRSN